jgi:hypothetical protein
MISIKILANFFDRRVLITKSHLKILLSFIVFNTEVNLKILNIDKIGYIIQHLYVDPIILSTFPYTEYI